MAWAGNRNGMIGSRKCIGCECTKVDGETGNAKRKVIERIEILEASFDVVAGTTKVVGGSLADGIGELIGGRGFVTGSHVEVTEANFVTV